ncbi:hypothetical protein [Salinispora arenicola]|uniref:hypothetical protein n=1 Tax=Salinispora arenicola TaxID=168697 RepID=UPI0012BB6850|nr:hypothetical protein [Salinispora arenicola]
MNEVLGRLRHPNTRTTGAASPYQCTAVRSGWERRRLGGTAVGVRDIYDEHTVTLATLH